MSHTIIYTLCSNGCGFDAECDGRHIGEITFVRIAGNKLLIDHTGVEPEFRNNEIGLNLLRHVVNFARVHNWRVVTICPFARAMFNRYHEFDDVRLLNK